ncbi:hypothetical protein CMUS01_16315, partial [Colletotrichum musicola]
KVREAQAERALFRPPPDATIASFVSLCCSGTLHSATTPPWTFQAQKRDRSPRVSSSCTQTEAQQGRGRGHAELLDTRGEIGTHIGLYVDVLLHSDGVEYLRRADFDWDIGILQRTLIQNPDVQPDFGSIPSMSHHAKAGANFKVYAAGKVVRVAEATAITIIPAAAVSPSYPASALIRTRSWI